MPQYRVKPGVRHGAQNQYGPGDIVELTEDEARSFLFKLERVDDEQESPDAYSGAESTPALRSATAADIVALVLGGQLDGDAVLGAAVILRPEPQTPESSDGDSGDESPPAGGQGADTEPSTLDPDATVDEILAAVDAGHFDTATILEAERAGKNRVSLIRELERRLEG